MADDNETTVNTAKALCEFYEALCDGGLPEPVAENITQQLAHAVFNEGYPVQHLKAGA